MAILDRRSGRNRRQNERVSVNIDVEWEAAHGRKEGTISDISTVGCFVLSSGELKDGDLVRIFLPVTGGMKIQFWGEVVNQVYEIGFAVRFVEMTGAQKDFLEKFVATLTK